MDIPSTHPIHRLYALLGRFRAQRMATFLSLFPITRETRVLDIGGTIDTWQRVPEMPRLTLLNVYDRPEGLEPSVNWVKGDARDMPFQCGDFDLVFSNSVIEHVGAWVDQRQFAFEVRRLNAPYWVQTPNRRFPIEPHVLGVGVQFLPRRLQVPYARVASIRGWMTMGTWSALRETLEHTRLLDEEEMHSLFPGATVWRETVFGLTKSLVAYQTGVQPSAPVAEQ